MTLFITSSHTIGWAGPLNPANDLVGILRKELPKPLNCAMVSSFPDNVEITDRMAWEIRECFEDALMPFDHFEVLDRRTQKYTKRIIKDANFIFLCGGHVPTENAFFHQIHLRELLQDWDGVIMGVSAGSMNCAATVYAPPELDGESLDPDYQEYMEGLGLTDVNILPHFQQIKNMRLDGKRLVRDLMAEHSFQSPVYCLPDGSFFMVKDGETTLHGSAMKYFKATLRTINKDGEVRRLYPSGRLVKLLTKR